MLTKISGLGGQEGEKKDSILLSSIPLRQTLFEPVSDTYGSRLALVFGNENRDGKCPFYGFRCFHCDIGAGENQQFNPTMNMDRLVYFERHYAGTLSNANHIVIYNSGSVLNSKELSDETLKHILKYTRSLEKCSVVSLDSREMYITPNKLDLLFEYLRPGQQPRPILGVETQDDNIRMKLLKKFMSRDSIESVFETVSRYPKAGLDIGMMYQPPGVIGTEAVEEAVATVLYLLVLKNKHNNIPLDISFHPYHRSKIGAEKFPDHPRADLHDAATALKTISQILRKYSPKSQLFVGWQDEEHDTEQDKRADELSKWKLAFHRFNISQDPAVLKI